MPCWPGVFISYLVVVLLLDEVAQTQKKTRTKQRALRSCDGRVLPTRRGVLRTKHACPLQLRDGAVYIYMLFRFWCLGEAVRVRVTHQKKVS